MKKIIGLVIGIAVVVALVGTGTWALFSDQETATDNTFTAGTLNLQVGDNDPCDETIDIGGTVPIVPTDSGNAATWLTTNIGTVDGDLSISLGAIVNNENTRSAIETANGDTTDGATTGELGGLLTVAFWMDVDKDDTWSTGDYYLNSSEAKVVWASGTTLPTAAYDTLDDYDSDDWGEVQTDVAGAADMGKFRVEYDWPDGGSTDNAAQSDNSVFTITFDLEQSAS